MSLDYKNKFISNNIWVFLGHSFVYLKGIILLPLLIKTVGVSIYGAYALILSYINILFGISSFGVGFRFTRFMPSLNSNEKFKRQDLFYFQFFSHLSFLVIIFIFLIIFARFYNNIFISEGINYSVLAAGCILFGRFLFQQSANYFRYTHKVKYTSIVGAILPYLYILLIVFGLVLLPNININYLLVSRNLSYIILSIPLSLLIIKEIGFRFPKFSFKKLYKNIKVGIPLIFVLVIDFILSGSDRFVLAYFMSSKAVGLYNPGYALGAVVIMIPKMIGVSLPQILSHARDSGNENEVKTLIEKSIKIFLILCIPFIIGGALLSKNLLTLLANTEVANAGYLVTPIVTCGILFYGLNYILANTVVYLEMKNQLILYSNILAAILNVVLNIIFISLFKNIIIAAITTLVSYLIAFIFLNYNTRKLLKVNYNFNNIFKIIIASGFMGIFIKLLLVYIDSKIFILFILIPSALVLYFSLIYFFKVINQSEINFAKDYIVSVWRRKKHIK